MSVSIFLVAVAVASIVWLQMYRVAGAATHMTEMMARVGLDPGTPLLGGPGGKVIMKKMRQRCIRCPREVLCDRWLAGEVSGDNSFCPNAQTFGVLTGKSVDTA